MANSKIRYVCPDSEVDSFISSCLVNNSLSYFYINYVYFSASLIASVGSAVASTPVDVIRVIHYTILIYHFILTNGFSADTLNESKKIESGMHWKNLLRNYRLFFASKCKMTILKIYALKSILINTKGNH
jgi:hypothetical protein